MKTKNILALASLCIATVSFGQVERVAMVETFTSSTCPPCNPGNVQLQSVLENGQNDGKYVSLKYQMSWPGSGDPYFTSEGNTRRNSYGVSGIPETFVDGGLIFDGNPSNIGQSDLNNSYAVDPKVDLRAYYQVDEAAQKVDIQVDLESFIDMFPGNRLYVAIYEYTTYNNTGGNGETQFEHVMKKMVPSTTGTVIYPMNIGDTNHYDLSFTFPGTYRLPPNATDPIDNSIEHSVEEFSDLGVAVWVQASSKEVLQAANALMGTAGLEENGASLLSPVIYPNPAAENATVVFRTTHAQDATVEVYNLMGELVSSEELKGLEAGRIEHVLNTSELAGGVYTVCIRSGNESINRRLSIQR